MTLHMTRGHCDPGTYRRETNRVFLIEPIRADKKWVGNSSKYIYVCIFVLKFQFKNQYKVSVDMLNFSLHPLRLSASRGVHGRAIDRVREPPTGTRYLRIPNWQYQKKQYNL